MTDNPFDQASSILDAAAAHTSLAGHEEIGQLLVDLGRTTVVPAGVAIRSVGVAAATSASSPGFGARLVRSARPAVIVLSAALFGGAIVLSVSGPRGGAAEVVPGTAIDDVNGGVERVVDDSTSTTTVLSETSTTGEPSDGVDATSSAARSESTVPAPANTAKPPANAPATTTSAPSTSSTTSPTTSSPESTTTGGPTTTVASTTTTADPGDEPEVFGNNGNGNGNGAGNGNGNQGNGGSNGGGAGNGNGNGKKPSSEQ